MKKKLFFLLSLILLLLVYGGVFLLKNKNKEILNKENLKEEIPVVATSSVKKAPAVGVPPDYIVVKETPEGKVVENTKKGISIKVPNGWEVNEFVSDEDLEIRKFGPGQIIETELVDGAVLKVYVDTLKEDKILQNPEIKTIKDWIIAKDPTILPGEIPTEKIGEIEILKNITHEEKGEIIDYSFIKNNKSYIISCFASGSQYEKYLFQCEDVIKDKIKNEF
ncbi:MAG: hypothetical protein V1649_04285 [Patescibacteria group bacterium]